MENIHHTHKPLSLDWLRDVQVHLRRPARRGAATAPRRPARWGSRLVAGL